MNVVFRVDGGHIPGVSFGHLFRCLRLAEELQMHSTQSLFCIKADTKGMEILRQHGFELAPIDAEFGIEKECQCIRDALRVHAGQIIIFDLPSIRQAYIDAFPHDITTIVIDDTGNKPIHPDIVINGSIVKTFHTYPHSPRTRYLLGGKYCLLGEHFSHLLARKINNQVKTVTLFFGGSDPLNLTENVVNSLQQSRDACTFQLVLGPGYRHEAALLQLIAGSQNTMFIAKNIPDMAQCFLHSDIAITAGGMTLYELAATGTPALCIPSIEHEEETANAFEHIGTIRNLGMWSRKHYHLVAEAFESLCEDYPLRQEMSYRGQHTIDGLGCRRVVSHITNMFTI